MSQHNKRNATKRDTKKKNTERVRRRRKQLAHMKKINRKSMPCRKKMPRRKEKPCREKMPRRKEKVCRKEKKFWRRTGSVERRQLRRYLEILSLCLLSAGLFWEARPKVVEELTVEAGSSMPELSDFLLRQVRNPAFATDLTESVDMHMVGDYEVAILISGNRYTSILHIVDTVAPVVTTREAEIYTDETLDPMDLIAGIEDATPTTAEYGEEPDFTVPGRRQVELLVKDAGGNCTRTTVSVNILEDTVPPVIEGVKDLTVAVGEGISYKKNVTVTDDHDGNVTLTVDSSQVNLNKAGNYTVVYTAEDAAGNVTEVSATVHVKAPGVQSATDEMVNAKADEILAGIVTPDMSQYEKAQAIFNWVHNNVAYTDGTPKTTWVQGAYRGLFERKGDCFVYAATSKYLLTRAGIANMDIGFQNPSRIHYWNLIDIGEGWYHFDTTRRADGKCFFYCSDAEIQTYSSTHNGSHAYDPSQYPVIQ